MIRSAPITLLAALTAPVAAQTFAPPEIGLQASGACRQLALRDRASAAMVPIGCLEETGAGFRLTPTGLALTGLSRLDTTAAGRLAGRHNPPNAVMLGGGNRISFCPTLSCVDAPSTDHQRASLLVSAETQVDGAVEEQTLAVLSTIKTGYSRTWAPSTAYAAGDNVSMQDGRNSVYRAVQAGTSAPSGSGPTGKGSNIVDGAVRWAWVNDAVINAKVGLYNEVQNVAGGGHSWAQANNFHLRPGHTPTFNVNTEFDFQNDSGSDCIVGVANCNNLYVVTAGTNKSTAGVAVSTTNKSGFASYFGIILSSPQLASNSAIEIDTGGARAIGVGAFMPASYTSAAIEDLSTAPAGLVIRGAKAIAGVVEHSTSSNGIALNGIYSGAQIVGTGWNVSPAGAVTMSGATVNGNLYVTTPLVPATAATPCAKGQISYDAEFVYVCVTANTWKRAALASW
ncbi:hypothetical protein OPKNFCMD_1308 [Methylobacterium crusticola]|uniref:Uncharacterized protein n=1 Tax=Methylobacterium crusticola TaxID=1697972 RepID=A0ABQ4QTD7_9HYPH|nr:hypothetical protein [Methylobacterium crusticola]GJD48585.1 hypothetical protein OPKNFCMD_1308 [Methylobacterium crusticola]